MGPILSYAVGVNFVGTVLSVLYCDGILRPPALIPGIVSYSSEQQEKIEALINCLTTLKSYKC